MQSYSPLMRPALCAGACAILVGTLPSMSLADDKTLAELPAWEFETAWEIAAVPEPSGLCFHPGRNTIFAVDDGAPDREAGLYELSLDCTVLASAPLGGDLEGVCFCEEDGLLYLVDESTEVVLSIDPAGLTPLGHAQISRQAGGATLLIAGGNGFEGISFVPGQGSTPGYFLLLNQDDPHCLVRVEYAAMRLALEGAGEAAISEQWALPALNAGELFYNVRSGELWVINSWMNVMQVYELGSMDLLRWEVVPGAAQEGLTIDGSGRLWIGQDIGGIARYIWKGAE